MNKPVRTRFAPSPTGYLHVGGARTALFNYLFARKHGGSFILRVEDTDKERNTDEAREAIFQGLSWLGMDWDEGPGKGGDCGPYNQSERQEIYDSYFEKLVAANRVYADDGAYRFRFERKPITMHDLVCGEVTVDYTDESINPDMVVKRSDGTFTFHFVNVVDDIEMGMTHVLRGEDHLMNTPKHLQLFEAFGVEAPAYAHIPLILNMDGSKMSKRDQGAAIAEYATQGYSSEAVFNFLALLGWSPKDESEIFSPDELIEKFTIESINRAPGKFDIEKCGWVNQQHLAKLSAEEFAAAAAPYVAEAGIEVDDKYIAIAGSIQEKVRLLTEVPEMIGFFYNADYPFSDDALAKVQKNEAAAELLNQLAEALEGLGDWAEAKASIGATAKANGAKPGQLMFPTRVALTGAAGGPDLGAILEILGQNESVRRIRRAVAALR
ncbi:glutamate--tRNA ligase [Rubritalea marina]|uniref:glutamate--tRNA ligase n=1 Tax=Rubritalea marina TaxID=361055 RepID=UPI0003812AB2|nr:glutamate--tRNA ligase family protein [Rubritalea marina]